MDVLLASASPRRKALLQQLGLQVQTIITDIDETVATGEHPYHYVARLARAKAIAGCALADVAAPVLGSDTAVAVDGLILGKPEDKAHALRMLKHLSGRRHQVFTAVVVCANGVCRQRVSVSDVWFKTLSLNEREDYWSTGEPLDKAGGYAIQGLAAQFITRLEGSYSGVMGLPLFETAALLTAMNILKRQQI